MIRILLKKKFLYATMNGEFHYRYTYLDLGYRGKGNIGQKWFATICQEDYAKILTGADILWHSKI